MTMLLPRLPGPAVDRLLDSLLRQEGFYWSGFDPNTLPDVVRYTATGGTSIGGVRLRDLRTGIVEIAIRHGFPRQATREELGSFDADLGAWIAEVEELATGEGLRDDVWSFVTVVLAPDVVNWRFGTARERFSGGVRNAFQRVWMRARVLDRGAAHPDRWGLLRQLSEDALVQITERPSLGADPVLARELAEAWVRAAGRYGRGRMEPVMRLATLRLRIRNEILAVAFLPLDELAGMLDAIFDRAASSTF